MGGAAGSTHHCCIICSEVPRMVRRRLDLGDHRPPVKQLAQLWNHELEGMSWRSYSSLATISASSTWKYSDSRGWPRRRSSEAAASAMRPFLTK